MTNIEELKKAKAEDFYYIGKRLKSIREDLVASDETSDKRNSLYSIKNTAERLGIDYHTMSNLERGTISVTTFKLLLYYYKLGYNPMWVIAFENEFIPKKNLGENLVYQSDVQDNFKVLETVISGALAEFKSQI
ncbi:hypothetical protein SAMN05428642_105136 [Flaviramulus basaltis]|uniref:Helix-turn-helix n=1 Tax=Flaviramulus basaltis TaxID=369401 RepID=A0A1K2IRC3_9FLAO|nr:hypothetical protein [Flaviramulus basaltis]SFZ94854.1 hypothetical protein SAMN05428642_105136 [Flaviramulus basaltis]|tara:strand:+ start:274 stop:675 length:402 start_codon:yes stop_codon:yes gene_type:complete